MPAQWTGRLIGEIHNAGFTLKQVAEEAGLNQKYTSQVMNSDKASPKARGKLEDALERLIARQNPGKEVKRMEEENPRFPRFHPEMTLEEIGGGLEEAQCEFWARYRTYKGRYAHYETRYLEAAKAADTAEVILDAFAELGAVTAGDVMEMIKRLGGEV